MAEMAPISAAPGSMEASRAVAVAAPVAAPVAVAAPAVAVAAPAGVAAGAVPLALPFDRLDGCSNFIVKQQINIIEAITQGCYEAPNVYGIFNADTGQKLFVVTEKSECFDRCCCAPSHNLALEFWDPVNPSDPNSGFNSQGEPVWVMERPGCTKQCLCLDCFICCDMCKNRATLFEGHPDREQVIARTDVPTCGGGCTPTLQIFGGTGDKEIGTLQGPCAFGGCLELCCDSNWTISAAADKSGDIARVTKLKPQGMEGVLREALTDSDNYSVQVQQAGMSTRDKATLLATVLQMDYMFFERDNCEGGKLHITLCLTYCCGCVCPFNCTLSGEGGGD